MDASRRQKLEPAIRQEAETLLSAGMGAAEFSARVFGSGGLLSRLWTTPRDRSRLVRSELYRDLQSRLAELRRREAAAFEQDVRAFSGRLTVVIPKSLHAALKQEASFEGVSLSELIRLKLGVAYRFIAQATVAAEPLMAAGVTHRR